MSHSSPLSVLPSCRKTLYLFMCVNYAGHQDLNKISGSERDLLQAVSVLKKKDFNLIINMIFYN